MGRKRWPLVLTVGLTGFIFLRAVAFPILDLDDPRHVFENVHLLKPTLGSLLQFWQGEYFSLYVPVTYSVWWLISQLSLFMTGRLSPAVFHAANLLLHLVNIYLLSRLLETLGKKLDREVPPFLAWVALMIFALHPWQAESVAWISSFRDILALSFSLLSLQYVLNIRYSLGGIFFALALLSKPGTVFLVAWYAFIVARITGDKTRMAKNFLLVTLLMAISLGIATKLLQPDHAVADRISWWLRPFTSLDALGFYLKRFFWAGEYSLDYGRKPSLIFSELPTVEFVLGLTAVMVALAHQQWRRRAILLGLLLAPWVAYLGLAAFQFQKFSTVADRYAYGGLAAVALLVALMGRSWVITPRVRAAVVVVVLLWVGQLVRRVDLWSSNEKIFRQTVQVNPNSLLGHTNLAYRLTQDGRGAEAIEHLRMSIWLEPKELYFRVALANLYFRGGDEGKAVDEISDCLKVDPKFGPALALRQKLAAYRTQTRLRP